MRFILQDQKFNGHLSDAITTVDWECVDADTQYFTHAIHRYSGKFIPQIAKQVIELLTKPNDIVVDPYAGSGTTLLECSLSKRQSVGIDVNPLAILISKVKVTPVNDNRLKAFIERIEKNIQPLLSRRHGPSLFDLLTDTSFERVAAEVKGDYRLNDDWYKKWYVEENLFELIAIHRSLMQEKDEDCRNIGLVAFSDVLRKCSNANSSYPNVMFDKNRGEPSQASTSFLVRLREVVEAVSVLNEHIPPGPLPLVIRGDARCLPLKNDSVDAVVTHPPYIASIPYAEYGALSLTWLGHDPKSLDKELTGGRRSSKYVVDRFQEDFREMIRESYRILKPGKHLFMLLGNPTVRGKRVNLSEMALVLADQEGFKLAAKEARIGVNRRANLMGQEALIFLQKC